MHIKDTKKVFDKIVHRFFFFSCVCGMWKFPGHGKNSPHSNPSCCSDNSITLTCCTRELLHTHSLFKKKKLDKLAMTSRNLFDRNSHTCTQRYTYDDI